MQRRLYAVRCRAYDPAGMTATSRDGCVVETEPLAHLLRGFVTSWNRRHEPTAGRFSDRRSVAVRQVTAVEYLEQETIRHRQPVPRATIQNIVAARYRTTELRVADALVTAIECPQAWYDGTLVVRPNPAAPKAVRASCCGGFNGSGAPPSQ